MAVLSKPIHITDDTIEKVLSTTDKPVIIDFWADWCGPCHMIAPILEQVAEEFEGRALVTKLNVDENRISAEKYGIRSIPTLLFFKNGKLVDNQVGVVPKQMISDKLRKLSN
ncbi:MAG TPA: thioredoxin [Cyclobacteriaceae bacterium]|jgi:thioredoxin 1